MSGRYTVDLPRPQRRPGDPRTGLPPARDGYNGAAPHSASETTWRHVVGQMPAVCLLALLGFVAVYAGFALGRSNESLTVARWLVWLGVGLVIVPVAVRSLAPSASRAERLLPITLAAALFYVVKVLHDPTGFGFPDELVHLANAQNIVSFGHLYVDNTVLPASPDFPGLAGCAALLSEVSGLGLFASGVLVVGAARLIGTVGLFLLLERLLGSFRLAAAGALIYLANSNWFFWSAQFAYESLSLPLLIVTLLCVVARDCVLSRVASRAWTTLAVVLIATVTVTHHLTSYALAAILWLLVLLHAVRRPRWQPTRLRFGREHDRAPVDLAILATAAAVAWLLAVATRTSGYLEGIFSRAVDSVWTALLDQGMTRPPFQPPLGSAGTTPLEDQLLAAGGVVCVATLVIVGLGLGHRRHWNHALALPLGVGAAVLLVTYGLRLFPDAWETGNRAAEFLFIGVALVGSLAIVRLADSLPRALSGAVVGAVAFLMVAGGITLGWPASARLPRPLEVRVAGGVIEPQSVTAADWVTRWLPADRAVVADEPSGRLMLTGGRRRIFAGGSPGVPQLLGDPAFPEWERRVIIDKRISYVVLDRRRSSLDNVIGHFFRRPASATGTERFYPVGVRRKYARLPGARLVFDSGAIVVYEVRSLWERRGTRQ